MNTYAPPERGTARWVPAAACLLSTAQPLSALCVSDRPLSALEIWLAASVDVAVPRLAVLASPLVASLVIVHLGRALTEVRIQEVSVLQSPGLSLDDVLGLRPDRPRPLDPE